jgi:hypothetical protein
LDGLLLKLLDDHPGAPGRLFWKLFKPIRQDLDRLFWCFAGQQWMAAPEAFLEDESATEPFEGEGRTDIQLWRPGSLDRYANWFGEEYIELWAIEPAVDDPQRVVTLYYAAARRNMQDGEGIIRHHALVWLLYTDSTCWEIYARKARLLEETREYLRDKPWVEVYESDSDRRGAAFGTAGLSEVWAAMTGKAPS